MPPSADDDELHSFPRKSTGSNSSTGTPPIMAEFNSPKSTSTFFADQQQQLHNMQQQHLQQQFQHLQQHQLHPQQQIIQASHHNQPVYVGASNLLQNGSSNSPLQPPRTKAQQKVPTIHGPPPTMSTPVHNTGVTASANGSLQNSGMLSVGMQGPNINSATQSSRNLTKHGSIPFYPYPYMVGPMPGQFIQGFPTQFIYPPPPTPGGFDPLFVHGVHIGNVRGNTGNVTQSTAHMSCVPAAPSNTQPRNSQSSLTGTPIIDQYNLNLSNHLASKSESTARFGSRTVLKGQPKGNQSKTASSVTGVRSKLQRNSTPLQNNNLESTPSKVGPKGTRGSKSLPAGNTNSSPTNNNSAAIPPKPISAPVLSGLLPHESESWMSEVTVEIMLSEMKSLGSYKLHSLPNQFQHLLPSVQRERVPCEVCFEVPRINALCLLGDLMVQCIDCKINVHRRCYGVHRVLISKKVPSSSSTERPLFICDVCRFLRLNQTSSADTRCLICCKNSGPRKRLTNGHRKWIHCYCALLSPDLVQIRDLRYMNGLYSVRKKSIVDDANTKKVEITLERASPTVGNLALEGTPGIDSEGLQHVMAGVQQFDGSNKSCIICLSDGGHVVKCAQENCVDFLHVHCLRQLIYQCELEGRIQMVGCIDLSLGHGMKIYCPSHVPIISYCVCKDSTDINMMVGCDICGDWLHTVCIGATAAEQALNSDTFKCDRCASQKSFLLLLDLTWSLQRTVNLAPVLAALNDLYPNCSSIDFIIPRHHKPLPFPDLLLVCSAWVWRMEALLSVDRFVPILDAPSDSPVETKFLLKKKITNDSEGSTTGAIVDGKNILKPNVNKFCGLAKKVTSNFGNVKSSTSKTIEKKIVPKVKHSIEKNAEKPRTSKNLKRVKIEVDSNSPLVSIDILKELLENSNRIPFNLDYWVKELQLLIGRCEGWVLELNKALSKNLQPAVQTCLQSHSPCYVAKLSSVPPNADLEALAKSGALPPKPTRVSMTVYPKDPLFVLSHYRLEEPPYIYGAVSVWTTEAIKLKREATVSLFLSSTGSLLNSPVQSLSMPRVLKVFNEIQNSPDLEPLKEHVLFATCSSILNHVKQCQAEAVKLRSMAKAPLENVLRMIDASRQLPQDSEMDLQQFPEIVAKYKSIETSLARHDLKSIRESLNLFNQLPISSDLINELHAVLSRVDGWRKNYHRMVSLMTSNESNSDSHSSNVRSKTVVGQSGFLKDLFGVAGSENCSNDYTHSQTLTEALELLEAGKQLDVSFDELTNLSNWIDQCNGWIDSVLVCLDSKEFGCGKIQSLQQAHSKLPFRVNDRYMEKLDRKLSSYENIKLKINAALKSTVKPQKIFDITHDAEIISSGIYPNVLRYLELRIEAYRMWESSVDEVFNLTRHFFERESVLPSKLNIKVMYPPVPYLMEFGSSLIKISPLLQAFWTGFSRDELYKLHESVYPTVSFNEETNQLGSPRGDGFDDDLFMEEQGNVECCVDVIGKIVSAYERSLASEAARSLSCELLLQALILTLVHFLVLCPVKAIRLNKHFNLLAIILPRVITSCKPSGLEMFSCLIPGHSVLLKKLKRMTSIPTVASHEEQQDTNVEDIVFRDEDRSRSLLSFSMEIDDERINCCIRALFLLYIITTNIPHNVISSIASSVDCESPIVFSSAIDRDVICGTGVSDQHIALRNLLHQICGQPNSGMTSLLENTLIQHLDDSTWAFRASQLIERIDTKSECNMAELLTLINDAEMTLRRNLDLNIDEFCSSTDNCSCSRCAAPKEISRLHNVLRFYQDNMKEWCSQVVVELQKDWESDILIPQYHLDGAVMRPKYILTCVGMSNDGISFLQNSQNSELTIAPILLPFDESYLSSINLESNNVKLLLHQIETIRVDHILTYLNELSHIATLHALIDSCGEEECISEPMLHSKLDQVPLLLSHHEVPEEQKLLIYRHALNQTMENTIIFNNEDISNLFKLFSTFKCNMINTMVVPITFHTPIIRRCFSNLLNQRTSGLNRVLNISCFQVDLIRIVYATCTTGSASCPTGPSYSEECNDYACELPVLFAVDDTQTTNLKMKYLYATNVTYKIIYDLLANRKIALVRLLSNRLINSNNDILIKLLYIIIDYINYCSAAISTFCREDSIDLAPGVDVLSNIPIPYVPSPPNKSNVYDEYTELLAQLENIKIQLSTLWDGKHTSDFVSSDTITMILLNLGATFSDEEKLSMRNIGGFITTRIQERVNSLQMKTSTTVEEQSTIFLMSKYLNATKFIIPKLPEKSATINYVGSIRKELRIRYILESLILCFMRLTLNHCFRTRQFIGSLPRGVVNLVDGSSSTIVADIGYLHLSAEFGIVVIHVQTQGVKAQYDASVDSAKECSDVNSVFDSSLFHETDAMISSTSENVCGSVEIHSPPFASSSDEVFFIHPHVLVSIASSVELSNFIKVSLKNLTEFQELLKCLKELFSSDTDIYGDSDLQSVLPKVFRVTTDYKNRIPDFLYYFMSVMNWRSEVSRYSFPHVAPYEILTRQVQIYQQLITSYQNVAIQTINSIPNMNIINEIISNYGFERLLNKLCVDQKCMALQAISDVLSPRMFQCNYQAAQTSHKNLYIISLCPVEVEFSSRIENVRLALLETSSYFNKTIFNKNGYANMIKSVFNISNREVVNHNHVEIAHMTIQDFHMWYLCASETIKAIETRQELQKGLLNDVEAYKRAREVKYSSRGSFNTYNVAEMNGELMEVLWDASGLSNKLPNKISYSTTLEESVDFRIDLIKFLYDWGAEINVIFGGVNYESLFSQISDILHMTNILVDRSFSLVEANSSGVRSINKCGLESLVLQPIFQLVPNSDHIKDLYRRCLEVEYLGTLLYSNFDICETNDLRASPYDILENYQVDIATPTNYICFQEITSVTNSDATNESLSGSGISDSNVLLSKSTVAPGRYRRIDLLQILYSKLFSPGTPFINYMEKNNIFRAIWKESLQILLSCGDPQTSNFSKFPTPPPLKTLQAFLSATKRFSDTCNMGNSEEFVLLRHLLALSRTFLTEARVNPEGWVKARMVMFVYPVYTGDEMKILKGKLQQKVGITLNPVEKSGLNEIDILKDGKVVQRYSSSVVFPNYSLDVGSRTTTIGSILSHAANKSPSTLLSLEASIRGLCRVTINSVFLDDSSADEREETLFVASDSKLNELYFKSFVTLINSRLQQIVVLSVRKHPGTKDETSIQNLLTPTKMDNSISNANAVSGLTPLTTDILGGITLHATNAVQGAGVLWQGVMKGYINGVYSSMPTWISPLFSPVDSWIYQYFENIVSIDIISLFSIDSFASYMHASNSKFLNLLVAVVWNNPEHTAFYEVMRPASLTVELPIQKTSLSSSELDDFHRKVQEDNVKVLMVTPSCQDNKSHRLWFIPPLPSITDVLLPPNVPKSDILLFGLFEVVPESSAAENISWGDIKRVSSDVSREVLKLRRDGLMNSAASLRVSQPATQFSYNVVTSEMSQVFDMTNANRDRSPKRARTTPPLIGGEETRSGGFGGEATASSLPFAVPDSLKALLQGAAAKLKQQQGITER